jgi:hypothetical protein
MTMPDPSVLAPLAILAPIFDALRGEPGRLAVVDVLFGLALLLFLLARLRASLVLLARPHAPALAQESEAEEMTPVVDLPVGMSFRERIIVARDIMTERRAPVRAHRSKGTGNEPTSATTRAKDAIELLLLGPGSGETPDA